jgi:hypothetical protein
VLRQADDHVPGAERSAKGGSRSALILVRLEVSTAPERGTVPEKSQNGRGTWWEWVSNSDQRAYADQPRRLLGDAEG